MLALVVAALFHVFFAYAICVGLAANTHPRVFVDALRQNSLAARA